MYRILGHKNGQWQEIATVTDTGRCVREGVQWSMDAVFDLVHGRVLILPDQIVPALPDREPKAKQKSAVRREIETLEV